MHENTGKVREFCQSEKVVPMSNVLSVSNQYSCDGSERGLSLALGLIELVDGVVFSVLGFVDIFGWYLSCIVHYTKRYSFLDLKRNMIFIACLSDQGNCPWVGTSKHVSRNIYRSTNEVAGR